PAATAPGLRLAIVGTRLLIAKVRLPDVPPPGAGLTTVTVAVPAAAKSLAGIVAISCVLLTKAVGRGLLFQRTSELATKFDPLTVSVMPPRPAVADTGFR